MKKINTILAALSALLMLTVTSANSIEFKAGATANTMAAYANAKETLKDSGQVTSDEAILATAYASVFAEVSSDEMMGLGFGVSYAPEVVDLNKETRTFTSIADNSITEATPGGTSTTEGDETALKASYAYGPLTVSYSSFDHDIGAATAATNLELVSMAVSYTVSDELSLTYGTEESTSGTAGSVDAEYTGFTVAYTAGGMTITGKMIEGENVNHANTAGDDVDYWELGASFAF